MSRLALEQQRRFLIEDLKAYQPEKIILFGSAARKDADEFSDLDVVIIKRTNKPFLRRLIEVLEFLRLGLPLVDFFVYTPEELERIKEEENPFIEQVLKDGKTIYEKS